MAITAAVITGAVVGLQHSLEADHLAAISTLADGEKTNHPGVVGASWGVGHSIPIVAVGLVFVLLSASLPESVTTFFEVLAGAILVYLGGRMLLGVAGVVAVERHTHDGHPHTHVTVGGVALGSLHTHVDGESFLVGIVHGLAGSGAIVVALAASASSVPSSFSLLASFSFITIATMAALSFLWGTVLTTRLRAALKTVAGSASLAIGASLLASHLLGVSGPLF
jgi:hypothetical protein